MNTSTTYLLRRRHGGAAQWALLGGMWDGDLFVEPDVTKVRADALTYKAQAVAYGAATRLAKTVGEKVDVIAFSDDELAGRS